MQFIKKQDTGREKKLTEPQIAISPFGDQKARINF